MKKLVLIGGGGHCRSVIDCVFSCQEYDEIGIVDQNNVSIYDVNVIGTDEDLPKLFKQGWTDAFVTVGSIGNTGTRRRIYHLIKDIGFFVPTIIDPTAAIARDSIIKEGSFVGKKAIVNSGAVIGNCSIVNSGAIIEHDCKIGEFSHISTGAVLCGQVIVGNDSHIGAGTVIRQQISIGEQTLIGVGSVVVDNIPDNVTAYGNPCKVVR